MPCHPTVAAGRPISVIPARRDGSCDPPRCGSRPAPGRAAVHASGVGCRFGIDVVVVSQGAMRARYGVEGAESLGEERTAGRRGEIVEARWEHRDVAPYLRLAVPNYARRQQYRRLVHAGEAALGSMIAALFGLVILSAGAEALAGLLLLTAVGLGLYARHWLSLAGRSRVGARSEDEVRRALAPLQADGWRLRHSLRWRGQGDIDSVAIAPTGVAVAIETKCAARRPVVSPAQPGGTRREVLGSDGLPGSER